jgi:hypothetical protein
MVHAEYALKQAIVPIQALADASCPTLHYEFVPSAEKGLQASGVNPSISSNPLPWIYH